MHFLYRCSTILLLVLSISVEGIIAQTSFDFTAYEAFLNKHVQEGKLAGAVSLVSYGDEVVHDQAFGYNSLEDQSEMTTDKLFYIQSMTKPIVSVAFMTLYEQGYFSLNDPVANYIPEFANLKVMELKYDDAGNMTGVDYVPLDRPVEIWHLLSHTAGFSHGLGDNEYDQKLAGVLYPEMSEGPMHANIEGRVKALLGYPLMGQPGEQWNYSASPDVLAYLIEIFSGKSADQYIQEVIFSPLGMMSAGYNVKDKDLNRVAGLHQLNESGGLNAVSQWSPLQGNMIFGGTHGLFCSARDYLKFGQMLLNGGTYNGERILSPKTIELMTQNFIEGLPFNPGNGFGLGFGMRTDLSDSKLVGSEGAYYWSGAFNTYFFVDPIEDVVAILMTQSWPYTNYYGSMMRQMVYTAMSE